MKKTVVFGLLAILLAFGMVFVGCDNGTTDNNGNEEGLPSSNGTNAVGGKTYYYSHERTIFSTTADGTANGTYVVTTVDSGTYGSGVKYTYNTQIETGIYSWNEETKTVTLKPEMIAFSESSSVSDSSDGVETLENGYGQLKNKTGYRSDVQAMIDAYRDEVGQDALNQQLSSMGFSSVSAYITYAVDETFANRTNAYSFSADNTALFLEKALPANKGTNQFTGQTYYGLTWDNDDNSEKDENQKYVFTASGYTFTESWNGTVQYTVTGSYAYDSNRKIVWLRTETINGKNRGAYYADLTAYSGHHYPDDNAYRAAQTNARFFFWDEPYNSANKTIGWED